jgi:hypothetical protein
VDTNLELNVNKLYWKYNDELLTKEEKERIQNAALRGEYTPNMEHGPEGRLVRKFISADELRVNGGYTLDDNLAPTSTSHLMQYAAMRQIMVQLDEQLHKLKRRNLTYNMFLNAEDGEQKERFAFYIIKSPFRRKIKHLVQELASIEEKFTASDVVDALSIIHLPNVPKYDADNKAKYQETTPVPKAELQYA